MQSSLLGRRCAFFFGACAALYTDASDPHHVTILNSSGESIEQLTIKASSYCEQYGKAPSFKGSDCCIGLQADTLINLIDQTDKSSLHALVVHGIGLIASVVV